MGGASLDDIKSATLDRIITWNFSNDDTAEMPAPKSTVHWLEACANDHSLISCTIDEQLLSYQDPWARDPGGRTGAIKAKKIDPKQILRIQSKLDAIMRPIAQQIIRSAVVCGFIRHCWCAEARRHRVPQVVHVQAWRGAPR